MERVSWKQFFAIICIDLCKEAPTLKELSEIMGSSHQNVKQILLKLEKIGFIEFKEDVKDKRKQRIYLTEECVQFCQEKNQVSTDFMEKMFDGIPKEQLTMTIQTILKMEENMKEE